MEQSENYWTENPCTFEGKFLTLRTLTCVATVKIMKDLMEDWTSNYNSMLIMTIWQYWTSDSLSCAIPVQEGTLIASVLLVIVVVAC